MIDSAKKIIKYDWLIESIDWLVHAKNTELVPYPLNVYDVGGPNP